MFYTYNGTLFTSGRLFFMACTVDTFFKNQCRASGPNPTFKKLKVGFFFCMGSYPIGTEHSDPDALARNRPKSSHTVQVQWLPVSFVTSCISFDGIGVLAERQGSRTRDYIYRVERPRYHYIVCRCCCSTAAATATWTASRPPPDSVSAPSSPS